MNGLSLTIPPEWRALADELDRDPGSVMIIGALGSGKTTFSLFLAGRCCRRGLKTAWLDADPGQPFIGPPGVLSLTIYSETSDLIRRTRPWLMTFIGNSSPVGRLLEMVTGLNKLNSIGHSINPDLLLINSCGLVNGGAARELKFHEIDMLSPRHVVALQKGSEVEHLLAPHSHRAGLLIHRLPISPDARVTTGEARRALREFRFKEYFRGADFQELALQDIGVHGPGLGTGERLGFRDINRLSVTLKAIVIHAELASDRLFVVVEGDYAESELFSAKELYGVREVMVLKNSELDHLLLGLNDDRNICLGLGILRAVDFKEQTLRIITPLQNVSSVRNISLGTLRVSPAGTELGQI